MKNVLLIILSILLLQSCEVKTGSGNIKKEDRTTKEFNKVDVGGSFEVIIRKGDRHKVTVEADDNLLEDIETSVSGGELSIEFRDRVSINDAHVKVFIESPSLNTIEASSAATVTTESILTSDSKMKFNASSAATITTEIDAPSAELEVSSSGTINIKGRTKDLDTQASSGSEINAEELLSENAKAQVSSGASIKVHASLKLNGQASSGGSISYRGNPTVSKQESSGGSVSKVE